MWPKLTKILDHNPALAIGSVLSIFLLAWIAGCPPRVPSLRHDGTKVTREELQVEIAGLITTAEHRFQDLTRQEELRNALLSTAIGYASGQPINPVGVLNTIAGILGVGFALDNRRKDAVIKTMKRNGVTPDKPNAT